MSASVPMPKHALVTGGAGFIGHHLVAALLGRGLRVTVLDDLSMGRRENVPGGARLVLGDVRDPVALDDALADVDCVFHQAALVSVRASVDGFLRDADVNFMGTFLGTRAALPVFRARGRGHLIIISSIVGRRGIGQMSGYSATKAAQAGFAEALRAEFAGTPVRVSIVYPVSTETEFRSAMARDYGHSVAGLGP